MSTVGLRNVHSSWRSTGDLVSLQYQCQYIDIKMFCMLAHRHKCCQQQWYAAASGGVLG
jgi:hypothetical protein